MSASVIDEANFDTLSNFPLDKLMKIFHADVFGRPSPAKRAHRITKLTDGENLSDSEKKLCDLVRTLAARAGLENVPEVWVYESSVMNAFTTGASKGKTMVAFSTGMMKNMEERAIAAVAAHEIAHIANGDTLIMSVVQSFVNCITLLILAPFCISETFSRKREYAADALAARMIGKGSMIHALSILDGETYSISSHSTMKRNNTSNIFSPPPSIWERIERLEKLAE